MTIHPVTRKNRGNRYCGPAAISIVTGCDTDTAAKLIRAYNGNRPVCSTYTSHLHAVLRDFGYRIVTEKVEIGSTLASWLRATHGERGGKVYVVLAGDHFQIVSGNRYCCSLTGEIVGLKHDKVRRRSRVRQVVRIEADASGLRAVKDVMDKHYPHDGYEAKRKKSEASARAQARRIAKLWDIEIESEVFGWGSDRYTRLSVWGNALTMDSAEIEDPFAGDHYADDWQDALERVEEYAKLLEEHQKQTEGTPT